MKKILKWLGIIFILLVVAIAVLPIIFKGKIISTVKEQANNNLNAKVDFGDIDLTLLSSFPYFTLSVDQLSIVGINEFEGDTLIGAKNLTVTLNLMSVIKGDEIKIRTIFLDQPHILVKYLKDGKSNIDIAKADTAAAVASTEPSKFKMNLKKLEIKNGNIIYDDAGLTFCLALIGFDHTLSGDFTQDNFVMETVSSIKELTMGYGGVNYLNKVKSDIQANLDMDMPNFKFTFKDNKATLNELSFGIDGTFAMPKDDMDMDLKFKVNESEFKNFLSLIPGAYTKDFASVKTAGKLSMEGFVKGIYGEKTMPGFGAKINIADAMFQYPSLPKSVNNIQLDVNIDNKTGDPDNTVIDINRFHVEMAGNPVDVAMHVETPVSDPFISGTVVGKVDLSSVKDFMPLEKDQSVNGNITANLKMKGHMSSVEKGKYEEFQASGKLKVENMDYKSKDIAYDVNIKSIEFNFTPQFVELTAFDAKLGRSDIQANGKIENFLQYAFKNDLLKGKFNMTSSLIDINQLMPPATVTVAATPPDTTSMAVVDVPGNIDFVLTAGIAKLLYDKLEITAVSGGITIKDKVIDMNHLKMNLLSGSLMISGKYNTQDIKKPKVDFDMDIKDFDVSQTSKAFITVEKLAPVAKYTTGRFSTLLKFNAVLDSKMMPVLNTLIGGGKLQTKAVVVSGFEPMNKLADALKQEKYRKMEFSDLNLIYRFEDGRVKVDPFDFKAGNMKGTIAGSTGFDQTIDYSMNIEVPRAEFGSQANDAINNALAAANSKGAKINLDDKVNLKAKFGGTVTKPVVSLDMKDIANKAVDDLKDRAKEELEKKKKELEEQAKAEAEKIKKEAEEKAKVEVDKLKKEAEDKAKAEAEKIKKEAEEKAKKELKNLFKKPK